MSTLCDSRLIHLVPGEVEATFLRTAMRNANLMSLLQDSVGDQELVEAMRLRLQTHDKERLRGFRLTETLDPFKVVDEQRFHGEGGKSEALPHDEYSMLCELLRLQRDAETPHEAIERRATFLPAISHRQEVYAIWDSPRYKDSRILFKWDGLERAGIIQRIFVQERTPPGRQEIRAYISVRVYERIDEEDPFDRYGGAGGFCCKLTPTSMRVIPLEAVVSHVAWTEFGDGGIHVLPLNRVSTRLLSACLSHSRLTPVSQRMLSLDIDRLPARHEADSQ